MDAYRIHFGALTGSRGERGRQAAPLPLDAGLNVVLISTVFSLPSHMIDRNPGTRIKHKLGPGV